MTPPRSRSCRIVALTARAGRAMLGAILGRQRAGEQTLLKRLVKRRPDLFAGRVTCFDRNFPGYDLITAILDAGGHVIARMKEGISLDFEDGPERGWLPDGSRMTWLNAPSGKKQDRLPVRVTEHNAIMPAGDGTRGLRDLHRDHHPAGPPGRARGRGAGDVPDPVERVGDHVRRGQDHDHRRREPHQRPGPAVRLPAAGHPGSLGLADRHPAGPRQRRRRAPQRSCAARALRRKDGAPVTADEESFTAARHHAIRSMTSTQVTATSSLDALAAAADAAARAALHTLNIPGRQRHSRRAQKARPKFPHATATKTTVTGKPQVTVFTPGFC